MAQFRDHLPSQQGWIHELARAEIHPDAEKLLQLGRAFDPQQLVEESTIDFLTELREYFSEYARVFNSYSESGSRFQEAKIYSLAQTAADFMIYRSQVKLTVVNSAHGIIQFTFSTHSGGSLAVDGKISSEDQIPPVADVSRSQELAAQVGPFRDVYWVFQGEKVQAPQIARFYFAEFVRATRSSNRTRTGNELLLEQIKSLLEEKGPNL